MVDYFEYTKWIKEKYHFLGADYQLQIGAFYLTIELSDAQIGRFHDQAPYLKEYKLKAEMLAAARIGCPLAHINPINYVGRGRLLCLEGSPDAIEAFIFQIFSDESLS